MQQYIVKKCGIILVYQDKKEGPLLVLVKNKNEEKEFQNFGEFPGGDVLESDVIGSAIKHVLEETSFLLNLPNLQNMEENLEQLKIYNKNIKSQNAQHFIFKFETPDNINYKDLSNSFLQNYEKFVKAYQDLSEEDKEIDDIEFPHFRYQQNSNLIFFKLDQAKEIAKLSRNDYIRSFCNQSVQIGKRTIEAMQECSFFLKRYLEQTDLIQLSHRVVPQHSNQTLSYIQNLNQYSNTTAVAVATKSN